MDVTYRNIAFREPDGTVRVRSVPTYTVPESYYNREYAQRLWKEDPAAYIEYMREVDEAFLAEYFGG